MADDKELTKEERLAIVEAEEKKQAEADKKDATPELIRCPCCGKETLTPPLNLSPELLDHYMACIMSGTPFNKTYSVYRGRAELTISMYSAERLAVSDRLTELYSLAKRMLSDSDHRLSLVTETIVRLRRALFVTEVVLKSGRESVTYHPAEHAGELITTELPKLREIGEDVDKLGGFIDSLYEKATKPEVVSPLPAQVMSMAVDAHIQVFDLLIANGFDSNFWSGIELA